MKKQIIVGLALASALYASHASAQATTYTFTGGTYDQIIPSGNCTLADCRPYVLGQQVTLSLTFAAPLATNLPAQDRATAVTNFSFSDGIRTRSGPAADVSLAIVSLGTDASGTPTDYVITLQSTPGPPYLVNTVSDPNSYVGIVSVTPTNSAANHNFLCGQRGPYLGSPNAGPGNCRSSSFGSQSSAAFSSAPTVAEGPPLPAPVPTMGEWAMILFGTILAGGAALYIQRRRLTA